ncbi:MAG: EamA/RhaT family transporter [Burkholderiales bacterium]|nr:EamA/RhaT family transporter [Burkholderiales bacterium]
MTAPEWLWIPITLCAAFAQTLRNAAQRHLTRELGTLGATLVRFLYGLPFAALWLWLVARAGGYALPAASGSFAFWVTLGAVAQIAATAFLLATMQERNFALGVAYSKTEIIQVAIFGLAFLGDPVSAATALAVLLGTLGVLLLAPADKARPLASLAAGWTSRAALLGLASGAGFALSAIGYRGAALALGETPFLMAAAATLVVAQAMQTVLLGGWLFWRSREVVVRVFRAWRASLFAGFMGATASAGWFTAFTLETAAHVRTLGLAELVFSLAVARRFFSEKLTPLELAGIGMLACGIVLVTLG